MAANAFPPESPDAVLDEIIAAYVEAVDSGETPDREEWLRRYPEAAAELAEFFADQDRMASRAAPLRACVSRDLGAAAESFPRPGTCLGDYELLEEISRGGMGIVFKARQVHLNRLVALKMILSGSFASAAELQRFRLEAEAAANLDHPNIVSLFEIGAWQEQPFFSMRLVEGGSLAAALLSGAWSVKRKECPRDAARLLATVARAVHYAHERGILHRDLKPANILVDRNGVPHVTDFGLAKWVDKETVPVAAHRGAAPQTMIPPTANGGGETPRGLTLHTVLSPTILAQANASRLTHTGMALGTPSYMAPEQAGARSQAVTTAADVYGLGAILYELLTGRPPFREATATATLQAVHEKAPIPPRAWNPHVPRDLETICLKCLRKEPARRYASAAALAEDLERYLRGEPIEANPPGRLGRLWRWCRRQPALAAAALLAIAGLVSASIVSLFLLDANAKLETALNEARAQKTRAVTTADLLRDALKEAKSQNQRADANYLTAHRAVEKFSIRFTQEIVSQIPGLQTLHKEVLNEALTYFKDFLKQKGKDPSLRADVARTYVRVADITSHLGDKKLALAHYQKAVEIFDELLAKDPQNANLRTDAAVAHLNRGVDLVSVARHADALAAYEKAADMYRSVIRARPKAIDAQYSLALTLSNMANMHRQLAQFDKAQERIREAQDWLHPLLKKFPGKAQYESELARNYVNLGVVLNVLGKGDEAREHYEKARVIEEKLVKNHPNSLYYRQVLASNYRRLAGRLFNSGKTADGLLLMDKSKALLDELVHGNPQVPEYLVDWATTVRELGDLYRIDNDLEKAQACYQEIYDRLDKLNARFDGIASFQNELALACFSMSRIPLQKKEADKALGYVRRCRALREPLVEKHPGNLDYRQELVWTLMFEGRALLLKGRLDDALAVFRQAIIYQQHNVRTAPQVPEYARHLRGAYDDLIKLLKDSKRLDDALQVRREAQSFLAAVSRDHSDIFDLQEYLARMLVQSAQDLRGQGRPKDALTDLEQAREIFARLTARQPKKVLQGFAHCHFQIGLAHGALEHGLAEQIRQYEIACNLQYDYLEKFGDHGQPNSSLGTFLHNLGIAYSRNGNDSAAEATLRKAVVHQRKALDEPNSRLVGVRQQLNGHYRALVDVLLKLDKTADAVAITLERQQLWGKQADAIFSVACDLGRCAGAVNGNNAERVRIAGMGLQALRQAAAAGFRDWNAIERHSDLAAVRAVPGYQQLLQEYKK